MLTQASVLTLTEGFVITKYKAMETREHTVPQTK